jgi:hypothetical protein
MGVEKDRTREPTNAGQHTKAWRVETHLRRTLIDAK